MSSAVTCINHLYGKAPAKRTLFGDKTRKIEAAMHVIEFPGGAIELSRLDDGSYWAHIIVNRDHALLGMEGSNGAIGTVVDSRVDWHGRRLEAIPSIPDHAALTQIAIRIMPERPAR